MKAVLFYAPGDIRFEEIDRPTKCAPRPFAHRDGSDRGVLAEK